MVAAGATATAGKMPGEEIAIATATADSSTFTAETQTMSVTAALINGETYWVHWAAKYGSSVASDRMAMRLREDSVSGTTMQEMSAECTANHAAASLGEHVDLWARYTAVASGNKTFSGTMARATGTGNCQLEAATSRPCYLRVIHV